MAQQGKANVLVIGGGAVGAIVALNIERGGLGAVTLVLRSNYQVVKNEGYTIESIDHGKVSGWRPTTVLNQVPNVHDKSLPPFDYVVATTKNCPDIPPLLSDLIAPAVTAGHTKIVLIQNGLNIEKPIHKAFPTNVVLSGISMIGSNEGRLGEILHADHDVVYVGPFHNPALQDKSSEEAAAHDFIKIYGAGGKTNVSFSDDVPWARWRKLVINAVLNPLCAITRMDTARVRLTGTLVEGLVRPAMQEVVDIAKALGHHLPDDIIDTMINVDPMDLYLKPSMQVDVEKDNFMEVENLVGEPLREAEKLGIPTPNLMAIYQIAKALQWKIKEKRGLVTVPPKRSS